MQGWGGRRGAAWTALAGWEGAFRRHGEAEVGCVAAAGRGGPRTGSHKRVGSSVLEKLRGQRNPVEVADPLGNWKKTALVS